MATIESIKQKILQLDAGSFQNLCDAYLSKIGYPNIVSLGAKAGTQKTTPGTPDAYFTTPDGKYIFVEYTTQLESLFAKIKDDLGKCLDTSRTGIPHNKISEIIYCHTSSNITPLQDQEVRTLCEVVGIKLFIIGIDKLSEDLYLNHPIITRDFLGISISTDQILSYEDFIHEYDGKRLSAPLDTQFLFRDKEIDSIEEAYKKVDIVVLSGAAGTGKTRLALHYGQLHSEANDETLFCIQNNNLAIYEDLKLFIDRPGNYFLVIDDANQLSGLHHIIRYTNLKPQGFNVKILITVRDYAKQKVKKSISEFATFEEVLISAFKDEEIKELLKIALKITNPKYYERIIRISEGNARIAMLAGKVACDSQRLESLSDLSQLYNDYYGSFLEEHHLLANKSMCITAGIVAFLGAIHLDYIDSLVPLLLENDLCKDSFIENIRLLHEQEIVDICNDKAVRFSEQCLSNYMIKYMFCDKKYIRLSVMIKTCLGRYKERTITSINTLLSIYRNQEIYDYIDSEIKSLWDELTQEESPDFFDFVKAFYLVNPTESLIILKEKINMEEKVVIEISDIDTKTGKNYRSVTNDIIEMLGGFADTDELPVAIDLFFKYYLKRPDLFMEFYHASIRYFCINEGSSHSNYSTQIIYWKKISSLTEGWKQEYIITLLLEVAREFLKLHFSPAKGGRHNTVVFYKIPLVLSDGVKNYRTLIWQALIELCKVDKYKLQIRKLLNYEGAIEAVSIPIMNFDLPYIESIIKAFFPANELQNCLLAKWLLRTYSSMGISCDAQFTDYLNSEDVMIYELLKGPDHSIEINYNERKDCRRESIERHLSTSAFAKVIKLINVCKDIDVIDGIEGHFAWEISEGLTIAFHSIDTNKELYTAAIKYYIEQDTPCNLYPNKIVNSLFSLISDPEVFAIITSAEYKQKNAWLYAYYHELPKELVTKEHLKSLYTFLADTADKEITSSPSRDVFFLEKYTIVDNEAFITGCKILIAKMDYYPFIVRIYFSSLFNSSCHEPSSIIETFANSLDLLEEIYFTILSIDTIYDYNGEFLKMLYLAKPSILEHYINYLVTNRDFRNHHQELHRCFFSLDTYLELYDTIFNRITEEIEFPSMTVPDYLENIILPNQNECTLLERQDTWIRQCIQTYSSDNVKMFCLFAILSQLKTDRKLDYILLFLENNSSYDAFEKIPLTPTSYGWTGSGIPIYSAWIDYFKALLPHLSGLDWLAHKNHVLKTIEYWKSRIEDEQVQEIIRG